MASKIVNLLLNNMLYLPYIIIIINSLFKEGNSIRNSLIFIEALKQNTCIQLTFIHSYINLQYILLVYTQFNH